MNQTHQQLLDQAFNEIPLDGDVDNFLEQVLKKFIEKQIYNFPALCYETREINYLHDKELEAQGNKTPTRMVGGNVYEGSSGWSGDKTFKHKWIIPLQLKFFMRNLICVDFWEDSNAQVRDSFMTAVIRGDDAFKLLEKMRTYFGANAQQTESGNILV